MSPDAPLLAVTGDADVSGSTLSIGVYGGTELAEETTITLLTAGGTLTADGLAQGTTAGEIRIGSTIAQAISVALGRDGNSITGVSSEAKARDGSKALSESWLSGLALTTQGADLVSNGGMAAALEAAGSGQGFGAFVAMGGSTLRYETGSSVHMEGFSMMAGAAASRTFSLGRGTLGAFLEYGYGSYDTYNAFNGAGMHGEGDSHYYGLGLMGRMDFSESPAGHAYVEASARTGRLSNEYENYGLTDLSGKHADFDSNTSYYGLHAGAGYVFRLAEDVALDVYGKYFWTRQKSDSVTLSTGEAVAFDASDSSRVRVGARAKFAAAGRVKGYAGVAFEREFDGRADATTNGLRISSPEMKGNTAIGEIGFTVRPSETSPFSIDANLSGYAGKRDGVTGGVSFKWTF